MLKPFEELRGKLERQYLDWKPEPGSGLPPEELAIEAERRLAAHRNEPLIRRRAILLELVLTRGRVAVDPDDRFAGLIETGGLLLRYQSRLQEEALRRLPEPEASIRAAAVESGAWDAWLDLSHTTPDWESIFSLGVCGLRDRARQALERAANEEAREFYSAAARVFEAMRSFILRLAVYASGEVETVLRNLAERPPEHFHEALQLAFLYHEVQEIEGEWVRSMGLFDRLFYRFYRNDIDSGRLTREQAKELLKFFWIKFYARTQGLQAGKNFCMGGLLPDGSDAVNDLTRLAYETYAELKTVDPKLSMRVHRGSPDAMLRQAAECLKNGLTATVFLNDEVAFPMFRKRGKEERDGYDYVAIGCYEPAIMGREMCCSMAIIFNLAKPLETLLQKTTAGSFEEFFAEYRAAFLAEAKQAAHVARLRTAMWPEVNPSPLLSGTMRDCIASGRDVSRAGTRYNTSGVMCAGIGSVADSLYAVKTLVYEQKRCTLAELAQALRDNWREDEELRQASLRLPKWGNNHAEVDALAREVCDLATGFFNREPNGKGATFQAGLWSIDHNRFFGKKTGALPDGRRAGEELSKNCGASTGMDRKGVTSLINSAEKLDHTEFPDGSVLDITLHPSAVAGTDGAELIVHLLRTYFAQGGLAIQFNIFDAETLRKAQREPEKYANLQVRVCGWNSRFIDLSPEAQESFIAVAVGGKA